MADPASILGTVVGVSGSAAQLSVNLFRLLTELKNAPQTLHDFRLEISRFRDLLHDIETILCDKNPTKSTSEPLSPLINLLYGCKEDLNQTVTNLSKLSNATSRERVALSSRLRLLVKKEAFNAS